MNKFSEERRTAGLVTGKSQHSALDFYEKIETNFLEKYLLYIVKDDFGQSFLSIEDIVDNNNSSLFLYKVHRPFNPNNLIE